MQTVGDFLKQEREYRNISLKEVCHSTKISGFYLDFLEKDDYGKIPGGPYIKGYISSYADCIGIDAEEALKKYESLNALQNPSEPALDETPRAIKKRALIVSGGRKKKGFLVAAVLLAGCMFGGHHFYFQHKPVTDLLSDSQGSGGADLQTVLPVRAETAGVRLRSEGEALSAVALTEPKKRWGSEKAAIALVVPLSSATSLATGQREAMAPSGQERNLPMEQTAIVKISSPEPAPPATGGFPHNSTALKVVHHDPPTARMNKRASGIMLPLVEQASDQVIFSAQPAVMSRENPTPVSLTVLDPAGDGPEYAQVQPDTPLELLETAVCTDVKDRTPSGAGESFAWSTARIYTWQLLRCDSPPASVRHVYFFKGQKVSEVNLEIRANLWRTWSYKTLQNEQLVGPWRVDILSADGSLLQSIPFTVN